MLNYTCDLCREPMSVGEERRVMRTYRGFSVEVIHATEGKWNMGHLCHKCVMVILDKGVETVAGIASTER